MRWLVLAAALLVAGCASSGHVIAPMGAGRLADRSAALVRIDGQGGSDLRGLAQQEVVRAINARRLFGEVHTQTAAPVVVLVTITGLREVDELMRLAFGAFAGTAHVNAHVRVSEAGRLIGEFDVEAHSSGGSIFAGGTRQAVEVMAGQVAEGVARF